MNIFNLCISNPTPPLVTNSDTIGNSDILIAAIISILGIITIAIFIAVLVHSNKKNAYKNKNNSDKQNDKSENPINTVEPQQDTAQQSGAHQPQIQNTENGQVVVVKSNGFLKFLGIVFLILIILGSGIFITKCAIKKTTDGEFNSDGNPVLLNRGATVNDFTLTESISATILNLKESYKLVPNVDIKNLEITFKYYDDNNNLIATKIKNVGNVTKSSEYTVSIEHSLSEFFSISKFSYYVSGGTVSYFA